MITDTFLFNLRSVQVSNPASAADFSVTVPTGVDWRIKAMYAKYVASATVASRLFAFQIQDGSSNVLYMTGATTALTASGTRLLALGAGVAQLDLTATIGANVCPLPVELILLSGFKIVSLTTAISTGDQWSNISLLVEESSSIRT